MLLVLVQPPAELVPDGSTEKDWRTWVEVPVSVIWANLIPTNRNTYFGLPTISRR